MQSLVPIPAGEFQMGSSAPRAPSNEKPLHPVRVSAFEMAVCAVTVEDYQLFLSATGGDLPRSWQRKGFRDPLQPVVGVSWFEAKAYCDWLTTSHGQPFHLPTEAQREWAARGGEAGLRYPWGDEPLDLAGPLQAPPPVGIDPPNVFGLHNLGDAIHEWCADWFDAGYYRQSPVDDPTGPAAGRRRAARGGSWRHTVPFSRSSARSALDPAKRFTDFGFRVVRSHGFAYGEREATR